MYDSDQGASGQLKFETLPLALGGGSAQLTLLRRRRVHMIRRPVLSGGQLAAYAVCLLGIEMHMWTSVKVLYLNY